MTVTTLNTDLTGIEARDACKELEKEMGPKADVHISISDYGEKPWYLSVYPEGMIGIGPTFSFQTDTMREALALARAKWEEFREEHVRRTISAMALELPL